MVEEKTHELSSHKIIVLLLAAALAGGGSTGAIFRFTDTSQPVIADKELIASINNLSGRLVNFDKVIASIQELRQRLATDEAQIRECRVRQSLLEKRFEKDSDAQRKHHENSVGGFARIQELEKRAHTHYAGEQ